MQENTIKLDLLDKKILYELDLDARQSAGKIAKKLKVKKETVNYRINRLQRENVIKGYYCIFDTAKIHRFFVKIFIKLKELPPKRREEIILFMTKQKGMAQVMLMEGKFDIQLYFMAKENDDLFRLMEDLYSFCGKEIESKEILIQKRMFRFNQTNLIDAGNPSPIVVDSKAEDYKLDITDWQILRILSKNAREPLLGIAKEIGTSFQVVQYHLKKLIKDEVIKSFHISINYDVLNLQHYHFTFQINDHSIIPALREFFIQEKKGIFSLRTSGFYDYSFEVMVKDSKELREFTQRLRERFAEAINVMDILHIYKEYQMRLFPL